MIEISRTVRFCISDGAAGMGSDSPQALARHNSYSAWPPMRGLGRYYELDVTCRGEPDGRSGYLLNIKHLDEAVREHVLDYFERLLASPVCPAVIPMGELMQRLMNLLQPPLDEQVVSLRFHLSPRYSLEIRNQDMNYVIVRQQYEFAAAHRLHVPELSEQENRRIFGKCNNPAGHGHNYRVEVAVRAPVDPGGHVLLVEELDEIVDEHVISKLDHKHLNQDVPQFANVNPSVENIVRAIWQMLVEPVKDAGRIDGAALEEVRVWETEKTVCAYRGE